MGGGGRTKFELEKGLVPARMTPLPSLSLLDLIPKLSELRLKEERCWVGWPRRVAIIVVFPVYLTFVNQALASRSAQVLQKGTIIAWPGWSWILGLIAGILWLLSACLACGAPSAPCPFDQNFGRFNMVLNFCDLY